MLELLNVLEKVFSMHVPWHSESDKLNALTAIQNARDEINPPLLEKLVPNEEPAPPFDNLTSADTATDPVAGTVDIVADTTTNAPSVTTSTTPDANVTDVNAAVNTAADNFVPDPEFTPFPGSYTPPPAA